MFIDETWIKTNMAPLRGWGTRRSFGCSAGGQGYRASVASASRSPVGFQASIWRPPSDIDPKDYARGWQFIRDPAELAARSDFLFVTLAASKAIHHSVGRKVLEVLENGKLGGAALDVFENEPNFDPRFLARRNVLLQPHLATGTVETREAMGKLMTDNLEAHFDGATLLTPVI